MQGPLRVLKKGEMQLLHLHDALPAQMQACGQPPDEIVQDLAPGLAFGEDGLPQLPSSATDKCTIC